MKKITFILIVLVCSVGYISAQEDPYVSIEIPAQNMLKFNRFMINPTFSTVRENKSYINAYHRNQWIQYDEAFNTYLLSYSGRVGDRTGLGLSLYSQNFGTISNFGVLANYAYGIRLAEHSVFTFGLNLSYYKSGFDQNQSITTQPDPRLAELQGNSLFAVQPGFNFAFGDFDIGAYAENLFDYNLKTSKSLTSFSEKTFSAHLQYTKQLKKSSGLLENGRLLMLARGRKQPDRKLNLSGSLILDLPKLGWFQGGFDDYYGVSAGLGFNLSKRISLGYTFERGVNGNTVNLGPTHEISFAYSFQPSLTENMVFSDNPYDSPEEFENQIIAENPDKTFSNDSNDTLGNTENQSVAGDSYKSLEDETDTSQNNVAKNLTNTNKTTVTDDLSNENSDKYKSFNKKQREILMEKDAEIEALKKSVAENNMIIDEIIYTQDSLEKARVADEERRFAQLMHLIKRSGNNNVANAQNRDVTNNVSKTNYSKINTKDKNTLSPQNEQVIKNSSNNITFKKESKKNHIKSAIITNLKGVQSGYYMIANVFGTDKYLKKFTEKLNNEGLSPDYFVNPKNNWKYVYLKRLDTWQGAIAAHKSKLNGSYQGDLWIMNVDNGDGNADFAYNQETKNANSLASQNSSGEHTEIARSESKTKLNLEKDPEVSPKTALASVKDNKGSKEEERTDMSKTETKNKSVLLADNKTIKQKYSNNALFKKESKKNHIRSATISNLTGVQSGYYIIANVFATDKYFKNFMGKLEGEKLRPNYFVNHKNNWKYVYLKRFDTWQEAIAAHKSKLDGAYRDDIWIMNVDNGDGNADFAYNQETKKGRLYTYVDRANVNKKDNVTNNTTKHEKLLSYNSKGGNSRAYKTPRIINNRAYAAAQGYYLIANVFSVPENANRFLETLKAKGLNADYFVDPNNHYFYVYVKKTNTLERALYAYHSDLNGQYFDDLWILHLTE